MPDPADRPGGPQLPAGLMASSLFGQIHNRPYQNGFPAVLTSTFDQQFGYSWAQNYLNDALPGIATESVPLEGNLAFTPDNNGNLQVGQSGWIEIDPQNRGYIFIATAGPPPFQYRCINGQLIEYVWNPATSAWVFSSYQGCCNCPGCTACTCTTSGSVGSGVPLPNYLYAMIYLPLNLFSGDNIGDACTSAEVIGNTGDCYKFLCLTCQLSLSLNCIWYGSIAYPLPFAHGALQIQVSCNSMGQLQIAMEDTGGGASCPVTIWPIAYPGTPAPPLIQVVSCPGSSSSFCGYVYFCGCDTNDGLGLCCGRSYGLIISSDPTFQSCGFNTSGGIVCQPCVSGGSYQPSGGFSGTSGSCNGYSGSIICGGGTCASASYTSNGVVSLGLGCLSGSLEFDATWNGTIYTGIFISPITGLTYTWSFNPDGCGIQIFQGGTLVSGGVTVSCASAGGTAVISFSGILIGVTNPCGDASDIFGGTITLEGCTTSGGISGGASGGISGGP